MGYTLTPGNTVTIDLEPDTPAETDRLFAALAAGGSADVPLSQQFWGGYFRILVDRFGIRWTFICPIGRRPGGVGDRTPAGGGRAARST